MESRRREISYIQPIKRMKANWIGYILGRNCLLKHIIEGEIEVTRRQERLRKQLLDDLKGKKKGTVN